MSETLKFGNGQWATKVGSTLAFNDENGNFKPLPFNFTRSTGATRVNKDGLIEVVTNNKPRIDFLNNSNGALLLEPSRTNLIPYSEDFTNASWTKSNSGTGALPVVTSNQGISPDGTLNADRIVFDLNGGSTASDISVLEDSVTVTASLENTRSLWIKSFDGNNYDILFGSTAPSSFIKKITVTNEWQRFDSQQIPTTTSSNIIFGLRNVGSVTGLSDTADILVWGAQLEQGSNATSYIPTQGAAATRVAETCSQTPPSGIIGQTEGTVYFEYFKINRDVALISIDDNTTNNRIFIESIGGSGIRTRIIGAGTATVDNTSNVLVNGINKIALGYANNNVVLYHNGIQIFTDNTATIPITSILRLGVNVSNSFQISDGINDFKLYDTRLSNTQLQQLTNL